MIAAQGGDASVVDDPARLPMALHARDVVADRDGIVREIDARAIGLAATRLGAGRSRKEDVVSAGAGVRIHRRGGERVRRGELLATLHADEAERLEDERAMVAAAFALGESAPAPRPLLLRRVSRDGSVPAPPILA
jgi:thymidine phosphorylase